MCIYLCLSLSTNHYTTCLVLISYGKCTGLFLPGCLMLFVAMYPWCLGAATDLDGFHGFHLFCMSGSKQTSIERSRGCTEISSGFTKKSGRCF